jgi:multiple sugar transport system permease protein
MSSVRIDGLRPVRRGLMYLMLCTGVVVSVFPLLWMISTSLKGNHSIFVFPPQLIPWPAKWENYHIIFDGTGLARALLNSLFICTVNTAGVLVCCSMAAYAFAKIRFRGRGLLLIALLSTMMIPVQITLIPMFILFREMRWLDTYLPLTIPLIFSDAYGVFLLRQFFMTIPDSLAESAKIDGARQPRIFASIMLPLCVPALAVLGLFTFLNNWNSFLTPSIFLSSNERYTVPLIITMFKSAWTLMWNQMMAAATVALLPILVVYIFTQRFFVQGIVLTGIKM